MLPAAATVFNPSHALFGEAACLLREDPRIQDRALYLSVLGAVAAGATTPAKIAAAIGRDQRSLHALGVEPSLSRSYIFLVRVAEE